MFQVYKEVIQLYLSTYVCIYTHTHIYILFQILFHYRLLQVIKGLPWWLSGKESACDAEDAGDPRSIPGWERSPRGGHGNLLQYSCLENPMDRGAW